jgi:hypothetical protein
MARLTNRLIKFNTYVNKFHTSTLTIELSRVDRVYIVTCDSGGWDNDYFDDYEQARQAFATAMDTELSDEWVLCKTIATNDGY